MKVDTKAKLAKSSSSERTAKLRLVGTANVSRTKAETQGNASERRTLSSHSSAKSYPADSTAVAHNLGNPRANPKQRGGEGMTGETPRGPIPAQEVFDNLSKTLAGHASQLPTEEQTREQEIRESLVESLKHFDEDRTALAGNLLAYKQVFKTKRQWTRVVTEIGAAIQVSARTVFRIIDDFERSQAGEESDIMIDLSPIQGARLDKEDRPFIRARLAIRSFLDEVPNNRKPQALAELLAEESYQIWGARNSFVLEVFPKPSRFTIDGRKQIVSAEKEKKGQQ